MKNKMNRHSYLLFQFLNWIFVYFSIYLTTTNLKVEEISFLKMQFSISCFLSFYNVSIHTYIVNDESPSSLLTCPHPSSPRHPRAWNELYSSGPLLSLVHSVAILFPLLFSSPALILSSSVVTVEEFRWLVLGWAWTNFLGSMISSNETASFWAWCCDLLVTLIDSSWANCWILKLSVNNTSLSW